MLFSVASMSSPRIHAAMNAALAALVDWPVLLRCQLRHAPTLSAADQEVFQLISDDGGHCGAVSVFFDEHGITRVIPYASR